MTTSNNQPRPNHGELVSAAKNGNLELVKFLLDRGADIEEKDGSEDTPLNEAARKGHIEIVRLLINRGARLVSPNNNGKTALKWAEGNSATEIFQLLSEQLQLAEEKAKHPTKEWILMAEDAVAHVSTYPKMFRKITEIFNFESRERLIIAENLKTSAESVTPPTGFDDLPLLRIEKALEQFTDLGGVADRDYVLRGSTRLEKNKFRS